MKVGKPVASGLSPRPRSAEAGPESSFGLANALLLV